VKDNLARYKVPREIITLDELPRNATGKVLKRELAEYDEDGSPGSSGSEGSDDSDDSDDSDESGDDA
jgi:fatty-acyl-CoA synthase